jgi:murein DD-endopeptidase MepM/ murein hydrolase activator NlpD
MLGNYVFIKIKEAGTYLVLGHLKYDSVCVKVGDYVKEGSVIAKAGNTGSSSEPHLYIHH